MAWPAATKASARTTRGLSLRSLAVGPEATSRLAQFNRRLPPPRAAEQSAPVLQTGVAAVCAIIVLLIVCKPSRKG